MRWRNEKMNHEIKMELLSKSIDKQPRKIYNKNEKYLIINGWLDIQEVVPEKNQCVEIKAEFWRNKELVDEEIIQTVYCGWNNVINHPIFEHETFDMQFMKVRFWKPVGVQMNNNGWYSDRGMPHMISTRDSFVANSENNSKSKNNNSSKSLLDGYMIGLMLGISVGLIFGIMIFG